MKNFYDKSPLGVPLGHQVLPRCTDSVPSYANPLCSVIPCCALIMSILGSICYVGVMNCHYCATYTQAITMVAQQSSDFKENHMRQNDLPVVSVTTTPVEVESGK